MWAVKRARQANVSKYKLQCNRVRVSHLRESNKTDSVITGVQVKHMEWGSEEIVAIADLPTHVAGLVRGLGRRTLVATKRQAPAADQLPAENKGDSSQASARQTAAATIQQDDQLAL